jgi:hypothetical protein
MSKNIREKYYGSTVIYWENKPKTDGENLITLLVIFEKIS